VLSVLLLGLAAPGVCAAQVQAAEREALDRLVAEAAAKGLPAAPLTNKIQEGLAKGHPATRIEPVVRQMVTHLESADRLLRELDPAAGGAGRQASVVLLAESFGGGVTADEVRELRKQATATGGGAPMPAEALASAAKGLSFIKEARLPAADGSAVIAAAVRQGYRSHEVLDVGREVKRREADYRTGRASLRALRDAIARGDRPDQLFSDSRPAPIERPAATRPQAPVDRVERPTRPEPARPEQPVRPSGR
jgi:hypothetical protein